MNDLKNQQISAILNTNRDGIEDRENAYLVIKTLELIEGHLHGLAIEKQIREKKWKILWGNSPAVQTVSGIKVSKYG